MNKKNFSLSLSSSLKVRQRRGKRRKPFPSSRRQRRGLLGLLLGLVLCPVLLERPLLLLHPSPSSISSSSSAPLPLPLPLPLEGGLDGGDHRSRGVPRELPPPVDQPAVVGRRRRRRRRRRSGRRRGRRRRRRKSGPRGGGAGGGADGRRSVGRSGGEDPPGLVEAEAALVGREEQAAAAAAAAAGAAAGGCGGGDDGRGRRVCGPRGSGVRRLLPLLLLLLLSRREPLVVALDKLAVPLLRSLSFLLLPRGRREGNPLCVAPAAEVAHREGGIGHYCFFIADRKVREGGGEREKREGEEWKKK